MREAWRHQKHILYKYLHENGLQLTLMLVYTQDKMPDQALINQKVEDLVSKLLLLLQAEDGARRPPSL